ncbi:choline/ethanolamine kinase [Loa loa]|nr:choline/ethanolamine kinase [Loa loa]EFO20387.2 choline/ethanolamine kinase [Loa loa]
MPAANDILTVNIKLPLIDDEATKEGALLILKEIKPSWERELISFKAFTVGITNKILCATYTPVNGTILKERLLFRIYGNNTDKIIDRNKEFNNWLYLASQGCAAQVYAKFSGGIVSGFLPGHALTVDNLRDETIVTNTCKALSRLHKLKPDTGDETKPTLFIKIKQFLANFSDHYENKQKQERYDEFFKQREISFLRDLHGLRDVIQRRQSEVVFCHNDLLIHNIIHDDKTDSISFIDYEYADYNYQDFDIANHFCEYAGVDDFNYSRCPDKKYKRDWITKYLTYYLERKPTKDEVDNLLDGNNAFEAAAHFFWALWALVQSQISTIDFGYLEYAIQRYELFQKCMLKCD